MVLVAAQVYRDHVDGAALVPTLEAVALAVIGIFTVANTVGGSSNTCTGGVCGDDNTNNHVGSSPSSAR
ncbi:hypothetical protein ABZ760_32785 [Streptomyces sp. NPDC006658]|uniref:hypothetical protein n=1 Tax=Streptomyces sp. NPDC006658 TaxID=3156900 RepID=UPI0033E7121C